jgi:hypothetical protein
MSTDAAVSDYLKRISELSAEAKGHRVAHKRTKGELADVQAKLDKALKDLQTVTGERDGLKTRLDAAPGELQTTIDQLRGQIRDRDHKDAWKGLYGDKELGLNPDIPVETVMRELKYEAKGDQPDVQAIKALVTGARDSHKWLFGQVPPPDGGTTNPAAPPALPPAGPGNGRGSLSTDSGGLTVKTSQLRDAVWMYENQSKLAEAQEKGQLTIVNG